MLHYLMYFFKRTKIIINNKNTYLYGGYPTLANKVIVFTVSSCYKLYALEIKTLVYSLCFPLQTVR